MFCVFFRIVLLRSTSQHPRLCYPTLEERKNVTCLLISRDMRIGIDRFSSSPSFFAWMAREKRLWTTPRLKFSSKDHKIDPLFLSSPLFPLYSENFYFFSRYTIFVCFPPLVSPKKSLQSSFLFFLFFFSSFVFVSFDLSSRRQLLKLMVNATRLH